MTGGKPQNSASFCYIQLYNCTSWQSIQDCLYEHFIIFIGCSILLLNATLCQNFHNYANELLVIFVQHFWNLYGRNSLVCNIRNLVHLADDAYRYGSLDKISAFSLKSSCRNLKAWYVNLHFLFNKLSEGCQKVHIVQKLSKTCWPILKGGGGGTSMVQYLKDLVPAPSTVMYK